MSLEQFVNNFATTINQVGGIGAADATVTVLATPATLTGQCRLIIGSEIIIATRASATSFNLTTRGAEGTTAATHADTDPVTVILTAGALQGLGMSKLGENLVAAPVATITFSAIPAGFGALCVIASGGGASASAEAILQMQVNADVGSKHWGYMLKWNGFGSGAYANYGSNLTQVAVLGNANGGVQHVGNTTLWLPNYAGNTLAKSFHGNGGDPSAYASNSVEVNIYGGGFNDTAPITQLDFSLAGPQSFVVGTYFELFGVA